MAITTVGALLIAVAILVLTLVIVTAPPRRKRSLHPLRDAYTEPDEDEE